jgi:plastocyanin
MIRMTTSKISRRRTEWSICLASWAMTALISFQAAPPGVAAALAAAGRAEVKIDNFSFSPAALTVKVGTQITWTNDDDIPHTVVSDGHTFKSKVLGTGEKFMFLAGKQTTAAWKPAVDAKRLERNTVEATC